MQCPSCRFENMPGSGHCARCGAALVLGKVDVIPPRARAIERRLPLELRNGTYRLRLAASEFVARLTGLLPLRAGGSHAGRVVPRPLAASGTRCGGLQEIALDAADWRRLVVPGWVQLRHGEAKRGRWLLGGTLALLLLSILMAGTLTGAAWLGALFSVHLMATVDAVCRRFASFADRIRFTLWAAGLLAVLVYVPVIWGVSQFARPLSINQNTRYFQGGDVVWYFPRSSPSIGDLVLYNVPERTVAGRQGMMAANIFVAGLRINRLIALQGQSLSWHDAELLVDGQRSSWQPQGLPPEGEIVVPENHVFILPEDLVPAHLRANIGHDFGIVPVNSIRGVVSWRTYPLHRFTKLD